MFSVIIPALDPDIRLTELVRKLLNAGAESLIIVNDGSRSREIFDELQKLPRCHVLHHAVNLGKGRALKTAFNYLLLNEPGCTGAVTADGDGQHAVRDIMRTGRMLEEYPHELILGVRNFSGPDVPPKSRFGNKWSCRIFRWFAGADISDTQTGLRGIPAEFVRVLMNIPGERFEYETTMLIAAGQRHIKMRELVIDTIYMDNNKGTHFHPVRDSLLILKVLFSHTVHTALLFCLSSLFSAGIDVGCFALILKLIIPHVPFTAALGADWQIFAAFLLARVMSSFCNYLMNRNIVFGRGMNKSAGSDWKSLSGYYLLCLVVMLLSCGLTCILNHCELPVDVVFIKAMADFILFILSFAIQKTLIFAGGERRL